MSAGAGLGSRAAAATAAAEAATVTAALSSAPWAFPGAVSLLEYQALFTLARHFPPMTTTLPHAAGDSAGGAQQVAQLQDMTLLFEHFLRSNLVPADTEALLARLAELLLQLPNVANVQPVVLHREFGR